MEISESLYSSSIAPPHKGTRLVKHFYPSEQMVSDYTLYYYAGGLLNTFLQWQKNKIRVCQGNRTDYLRI